MWIVNREFLAGKITRGKVVAEIKRGSTLIVADQALLPKYPSDVPPDRVPFLFAGGLYWTFEWIFREACDDHHRD